MSSGNANDRTAKLSMVEKVGYGFGDAGFNFYWAIIGSYLLFFYTDIFGISSAAAATMFLITKIVDACTDPAMGFIADRTNTRWGKFRPYLLFGALPMMGAAVLTMSTPDLGEGGKLLWAYGTYSAMMLTYTILSTPYSSLAGVLTADGEERNQIFSIRFFFAFLVGTIVNVATPILAQNLGDGSDAKGWQMTMLIYSSIATVIFWITFATTKERVAPPPEQQSKFTDDIKDLIDNKPWLVLFALAMIIMITITMRGSSGAYYFKYFVERPDLMGPYLGLQFAAYAVGVLALPSLLKLVPDKAKLLTILMSLVGILCIIFTFVPKPAANGVITINSDETITLEAKDLVGEDNKSGDAFQWIEYQSYLKFFKKRVELEGETGHIIVVENAKDRVFSVVKTSDADGQIIVIDSAKMPIEIIIMFALNILISLCLGPKSPLTWSMYADAADYNEWKTGRRATAMTFSAATFSQKLGGALGSFLIGSVLALIGYSANEAQSDASQSGIVLLQTLVPGIFAFISVFALRYYDLSKSMLDKIQAELKDRDSKRTV